ncbi:MAG: carbohydrate binding family 9 domain-containing protein [Janthinobacterium lividum]
MKIQTQLLKAALALLCLFPPLCRSQQAAAEPQAATRTPHPSQLTSRDGQVAVPSIDRAVTLNDFAGMKPSEWAAEHLARAGDMVQNQPFDGKPPTERTEVWMGRTATTFYVAFICFDHQPASMRGHLARRENISADDSVGLLLDPFQDRRRGVLFQLNPAGVQADANWTEPGDQDYSYDQVWDSSARRTPNGWMALMAIPFRSIRSRSTAPQWGVVLMRQLPRNSETDYWPRVSQSISGTLSQEGSLLGMNGETSHNIQINPYGILHRLRQINTDDPMNPFFSNRNLSGTAGGDVKAVIKDTIVLDGTVNPDFSQIESDQPQFRVNQRYALFYPELRPFFLENSSYFDTPITLLYTRTIGNPEFGARATGKIRHTNIGLLAIDDRDPGIFVAPTDPLHGKRAFTLVGRVSQDIGKFSSLGAIYVQRTLNGSSNRVGGVDFSARINQHWQLSGMTVVSSTHQLDGSYNAGPATRLRVSRTGHSFFFNEQYRDFSQGYEADAGFVTVPQVRQSNTNANYQWYPTGPFAKRFGIQSYGVETNLRAAWNRRGERVFHYSNDDVFVALAHNTIIAPIFQQNSDSLGPADYSGLTRRVNFSENKGGLVLRSSPRPQVSLNIEAFHGATVNYNPVGDANPALLKEDSVNAMVTLQPISPLTIDNTYLLDRTSDAHTAAHAYESQTFRTKINYQFTRSFSLRAIVQYDSVARNALVSSLERTKQVGTQVLFTWLPHPGTALYAGYNSDLQNLNRNLCTRLMTGQCDSNYPIMPRSNAYLGDGREIFIKASYLLRF